MSISIFGYVVLLTLLLAAGSSAIEFAIEGRGVDPTQEYLVVTHIRLPRLFLGLMIGAALAIDPDRLTPHDTLRR